MRTWSYGPRTKGCNSISSYSCVAECRRPELLGRLVEQLVVSGRSDVLYNARAFRTIPLSLQSLHSFHSLQSLQPLHSLLSFSHDISAIPPFFLEFSSPPQDHGFPVGSAHLIGVLAVPLLELPFSRRVCSRCNILHGLRSKQQQSALHYQLPQWQYLVQSTVKSVKLSTRRYRTRMVCIYCALIEYMLTVL